MSTLQKLFAVFGRVFLSFIFLLSGVNKLVDWSGSEEALAQAMNHAMTAYESIDWLYDGIAMLLPWTSVLLVIALVFELVGGLFVFFGVKARFGAFLLILFLIPATFFFHGFWTYPDVERHVQLTTFLRNLSIFGGLLLVLATSGSSKPKAEPIGDFKVE